MSAFGTNAELQLLRDVMNYHCWLSWTASLALCMLVSSFVLPEPVAAEHFDAARYVKMIEQFGARRKNFAVI
jgi:hypothetical protein